MNSGSFRSDPRQNFSGESAASLSDGSPWPVATTEGANHVLSYANPAFCRLITKEKAKLLGKRLCEIIALKDVCIAIADRVFRNGQCERFTQEKSVNNLFGSFTAWPMMTGTAPSGVVIQVTEAARSDEETLAMNEALILGMVRQNELTEAAETLNRQLRVEIDQRTRAEDALRASEECFRALFDLGPVAIFSCDRAGIIQNFNRRAAELWGLEPKSGSDGDHLSEVLKFCHQGKESVTWTDSLIFSALRDALSLQDHDAFIERADGSRITVAVTFVPLKDNQGEVTGGITAFYDITARRLLEASLAARAADLARADRSKDEFLAMLAHELRNPLAPLRNAAEILNTTTRITEREQAQSLLSRQIDNMSRMIDDLLDVSRINEGKIELRKRVIDLARIITAAADATRPSIEARAQELKVTLPLEKIFLVADSTRLEQVFGNLLNNANKYGKIGGHISLSVKRMFLDDKESDEVLVCVSDDGIGISPELQPHIFDLFVQGTRSLDRACGGLGIGLTLVDRLVKMHGGSVEVNSGGAGQGSEFIVRLPTARGPVSLHRPNDSPDPEAPCRILIVDDNQDSALSMSILQRLRGHETRIAHAGIDALALALDFVPEVVLLDIGLPEMDGFEVCRRMRELPAMADAFFVAMTGYDSAGDRARGKAAGFDEYLVKPVDLDLLHRWLQSEPQGI